MNTIKLFITRDKSFVASAMPYRIYINNREVATIRIGKSITLDLPATPATLKVAMVGNAMTFHRIEKEVALFPQNCDSGVIECLITTKPNWLGILSLGLFQSVGRTELLISYK